MPRELIPVYFFVVVVAVDVISFRFEFSLALKRTGLKIIFSSVRKKRKVPLHA